MTDAALNATFPDLPANFGTPSYRPAYRGEQLLVTEITMTVVTLVVVALRVYVRTALQARMHSDDWWTLLALGFLLTLTIFHSIGVKFGTGLHLWDVPERFGNTALVMFYIGQLLYIASLGSVKISLLLFIQRITPSKTMRKIVRAILIFVLAFSITAAFLFAFQCSTPDALFVKIKSSSGSVGQCLSPQGVHYPIAGINIVTDVIIWLLPVRMIIRSKMTKREKLGLLWVFALGGVAVVAGIVRPWTLTAIMKSGDPTWSYVPMAIWAVVEVSIAIICASLPALRPLILKLAPTILGVRSHTGNTFGSGNTGSKKDSTFRAPGSRNPYGSESYGMKTMSPATVTASVVAPQSRNMDLDKDFDIEELNPSEGNVRDRYQAFHATVRAGGPPESSGTDLEAGYKPRVKQPERTLSR